MIAIRVQHQGHQWVGDAYVNTAHIVRLEGHHLWVIGRNEPYYLTDAGLKLVERYVAGAAIK